MFYSGPKDSGVGSRITLWLHFCVAQTRAYRFLVSTSLLLLIVFSNSVAQRSASPRVFILDGKKLAETKQKVEANDEKLAPAVARLEKEAQQALTGDNFSVVTKTITPPSGDKHDYMSQAPYFWPDPTKSNGLPYIRRDGERNPEINKISDHRSMDQMIGAVRVLSLAYFLKGDERYATKARQLLRVWFIEPATRMNPNLQYGQGIPGITTGRGIGLIETRNLTDVVDSVGLLAGAKVWTKEDQRGVERWYEEFLQWMLSSKNGRDEAAAKNNHGTYYDVQVTSFALFLGKKDLAKQTVENAKLKRIAVQVEPDGRQPLELARTRAWSYSNGNLDGLMLLARLAENVDVDLWSYQTRDGRSIRRALDYLYPFAVGDQKWTYQQLGEWPPQTLFPLMRRAAPHFEDRNFKTMMTRIPALGPSDRERLLTIG